MAQSGTGVCMVSGKDCHIEEMSNLLSYLLARLVFTGLRQNFLAVWILNWGARSLTGYGNGVTGSVQ